MSDGCEKLLKPGPTGLGICTSEICFDTNFSCLEIPVNANLSAVLQIMEAAICSALYYTGSVPSCVSGLPTQPTIQDVVQAYGPKICLEESFIKYVETLVLSSDGNYIDSTYFVPATGDYDTLIYTNSSGSTKTYIVTGICDIGDNNTGAGGYGSSDVDMGIFKRDLVPSDTLDDEVKGAIQILYTYSPSPGDLVASVYNIETSNTIMSEIELQDGESVLLKFKTKGAGAGTLRKASLHVRQKHT